MSNIYIQEPPTEGKVLLVTSAGDFDIELWSKEAPKACRNFVQLCMEGYYSGTIFHRVVSGFIVQGGDPTGTGTGGDSIYGKPFKDEFHTRLRFVRRGLVAMANAGPNDNGSQFFFSLGTCPELQNKHTIFGKIAGSTIYNLPRFEEGEIGKDDRPEYPHKIMSTEVLKNPFSDIEPRISEKIQNEVPKESRKLIKGTKDFKLLSFGDEAEEDEEVFTEATKKLPNQSNSAHDIAMDPTLSYYVPDDTRDREQELNRIRQKFLREKEAAEIFAAESNPVQDSFDGMKSVSEQKDKRRGEIRAEIRKLKRELKGDSELVNDKNMDEENNSKKPKMKSILQQYHEDNAKYTETQKSLPKKGPIRESETLALLARFSERVRHLDFKSTDADEFGSEGEDDPNDDSWISHRLQFDNEGPVQAKDASNKDDHWYDLNDPRNAMNKRRREQTLKSAT